MRFKNFACLLTLAVTLVFSACRKETIKEYHPIEKYIQENNKLGLSKGKKVVVVINSNTCPVCGDQASDFASEMKNPAIKLIFSIERKKFADIDIIEASENDTVTYFVDYNNTPFRKGLVANKSVVYFLSEGIMIDSTQLTPETAIKVKEFLH